jgi:hypothetical protein
MPLTISIRFLTGRAHLHHWQAHHSDGRVDWPPSPWRLLRALVAAAGSGLTSLPEPLDTTIADLPDDILHASRLANLLAALANPPVIWLPRTGGGHTRQFLPRHAGGTVKPTGSVVFDTFATVSKETPVVFEWPRVHFTPGDSRFSDLQILLRRLTYFGRAESWCDAAASLAMPGGVKRAETHWPCVCLENDLKPEGREHADYTLERKLASCWPLLPASASGALAHDATRMLTRLNGTDRNEDSVGLDAADSLKAFPLEEFSGRLLIRQALLKEKSHSSSSDESFVEPPKKSKEKPWELVARGHWSEDERAACLKHSSLKNKDMKSAKKTISDVLRKRVEGTAASQKWDSELERNSAGADGGILLLRCLLRSSGEDINEGLERPVGSRWVHYSVPRAIYQIPAAVTRQPALSGANRSPITLVRFALNTTSVNRPVLPPLTDTLLVADKFRSAALAWHGHLRSGEHPRNLCGREDDRSRVVGHDHAYFWPMDEDGDGFIDHVSVLCPAGFRASETDALRRLLRIKQRGGRPDLLVTPVFLGQHEQFWPEESKANIFVSATPYFSPVHITHGRRRGEKRNRGGRSRLGKQVLGSLGQAKLIDDEQQARIEQIVIPPIGQISAEFGGLRRLTLPQFPGALCLDAAMPFPLGFNSALAVENGGRWIRSFAFCRRRRDYEVTANGRMLLIEFAASRAARPFAIGDQAHFGLGLFVPAE